MITNNAADGAQRTPALDSKRWRSRKKLKKVIPDMITLKRGADFSAPLLDQPLEDKKLLTSSPELLEEPLLPSFPCLSSLSLLSW